MPSSDPLSPLPPSPATASGLSNHQPSDVRLASGQQHRKHTGSSLPTRMSLCNDVVFKTLFCRHPHLLSDLINAVRYPAPSVQVRTILNPHILPQDLEGKHIVLDIL